MKQDKIQQPKPQKEQGGNNPHTHNTNNHSDRREFGCPCGKSYLSYPALYTHVKSKHDGKPPGEITKPKNQKTRGRPRNIIVEQPIDNSQQPFDIAEQITKLSQILPNSSSPQPEAPLELELSTGSSTCQDMASQFLQQLSSHQCSPLIKSYLVELKQFVDKKYGEKYWKQNTPQDLIDVANQFQQTHQLKKQKSCLPKNSFIQITYLLFKWMYRNNWTIHKLAIRPPQTQTQSINPNVNDNKDGVSGASGNKKNKQSANKMEDSGNL